MINVPDTKTDEERRNIRQQLQTQRMVLISMLNPAPTKKDGSFPQSMTMRMLSGKSTLMMLFMAEALPLLMARYIAKSSFRK